MLDVATVFDQLDMRCPRLGGTITFDYCRKVNKGLPCNRSLICWEAAFPVHEYMIRILDEDEWRKVFETPPTPRLDALLNAASEASSRLE